jgi:hypothetical protein
MYRFSMKNNKIRNTENLIYKTKIPLLFYFWILLILITEFIIINNFESILIFFIEIISIPLILYFIFCKYSCIIFFTNNGIKIKYLLPVHENINITIEDIKNYSFQISPFSRFSKIKSMDNIIHFKIVFYDILYINSTGYNLKIKIHTRNGELDKITKFLDNHTKF